MRLYVGNLPFACSEQDLKELFSEYNASDVKLIIDRETGRSKGFGFVEIASKDEAQKAIQAMNNKEVNGKTLVVNEARPQQKREGGMGGGMGGGNRGGGSRPFGNNKGPRRYGNS